ncbi:MAG: plasmid mobilization relaxosome protein MobC [Candidatus Brevundimonas colombiensis]|uniref:Plasmid mobilization relaxosome protein MobC n=1 Tax=Candidatus Brevundimonas colombiensis TaxID=3121376 RepID=A0AAJ5WWZ4_9CAUL|nr:plasmid mobilization relaxosome protein MobC [Brevundimonas sp.]WEK39821.1 MAG: plasmid mobilization relaxosome protein MobC [Brevundimonas sp.]
MDRFTLRLPPDLARRFDAAAVARGGRSRYLRALMEAAAQAPLPARELAPCSAKSAKLTLRLADEDMALLEAEAGRAGLLRTQWAVMLVRRRLHGRLQLTPPEAMALIGVRRELHRIGVNINQIARALNTAVMEGAVLDLEVAQLAAFASEIRVHLSGLDELFAGNLAYWSVEP